MDDRVKAIRENVLVGKHTCAIVSECYSDEGLVELLDEWEVSTPKAAIEFAVGLEDINIEDALNYRLGTDNDPELAVYNEWQELKKVHGL